MEKKNRLQNISLWIVITAILINQCYQTHWNYQEHHHLHKQLLEVYEHQNDVEEERLLFYGQIVEILEDHLKNVAESNSGIGGNANDRCDIRNKKKINKTCGIHY